MIKLFSNKNCPFAKRARIALNYAKYDYELIEVDFANKPKELFYYSSKATTPVLVINDELVIDQSIDIVLYVEQNSDSNLWEKIEKSDRVNFIQEFEVNFLKNYINLRHDPSNLESLKQAQDYLDMILSKKDDNSYLYGDKMSVLDIIIAPFIGNFLVQHPDYSYKFNEISGSIWLDSILDYLE